MFRLKTNTIIGYFPHVKISTELPLYLIVGNIICIYFNNLFFSSPGNVSAFTADTTQGTVVVGTLFFFFYTKKGLKSRKE